MPDENVILPGDLREVAQATHNAEMVLKNVLAAEHELVERLQLAQENVRRARALVATSQARVRDLQHIGAGNCAWKMDLGVSRHTPSLKPCPRKAALESRFCEVHRWVERSKSDAVGAGSERR